MAKPSIDFSEQLTEIEKSMTKLNMEFSSPALITAIANIGNAKLNWEEYKQIKGNPLYSHVPMGSQVVAETGTKEPSK